MALLSSDVFYIDSMVPKISVREGLLLAVVLILVIGSLVLAILDPTHRQAFSDLSKIGISGFIGWMMPVDRGGRHLP